MTSSVVTFKVNWTITKPRLSCIEDEDDWTQTCCESTKGAGQGQNHVTQVHKINPQWDVKLLECPWLRCWCLDPSPLCPLTSSSWLLAENNLSFPVMLLAGWWTVSPRSSSSDRSRAGIGCLQKRNESYWLLDFSIMFLTKCSHSLPSSSWVIDRKHGDVTVKSIIEPARYLCKDLSELRYEFMSYDADDSETVSQL